MLRLFRGDNMFNLIVNLFNIESCQYDKVEKRTKDFHTKDCVERKTTSTRHSEAVPPEVDGPENSIWKVN